MATLLLLLLLLYKLHYYNFLSSVVQIRGLKTKLKTKTSAGMATS